MLSDTPPAMAKSQSPNRSICRPWIMPALPAAQTTMTPLPCAVSSALLTEALNGAVIPKLQLMAVAPLATASLIASDAEPMKYWFVPFQTAQPRAMIPALATPAMPR